MIETARVLCAALVATGALAAGARAWDLEGRVSIVRDSGSSATSHALGQGTIVYFEPAQRRAPEPTTVEVVMARKEFIPRVAVAPVGSSVRFPNHDPILHNAFSVSQPNGFDLGLYHEGEGEAVKLDHAGVVRVFCNVHHSMVAYVLVLETPYFTRPAPDGSFTLKGLPAGGGTLTVWHEQSQPWESPVEQGDEVNVELSLDRDRVPHHANKFGKPYSRERRRTY